MTNYNLVLAKTLFKNIQENEELGKDKFIARGLHEYDKLFTEGISEAFQNILETYSLGTFSIDKTVEVAIPDQTETDNEKKGSFMDGLCTNISSVMYDVYVTVNASKEFKEVVDTVGESHVHDVVQEGAERNMKVFIGFIERRLKDSIKEAKLKDEGVRYYSNRNITRTDHVVLEVTSKNKHLEDILKVIKETLNGGMIHVFQNIDIMPSMYGNTLINMKPSIHSLRLLIDAGVFNEAGLSVFGSKVDTYNMNQIIDSIINNEEIVKSITEKLNSDDSYMGAF